MLLPRCRAKTAFVAGIHPSNNTANCKQGGMQNNELHFQNALMLEVLEDVIDFLKQ